MPTVIARWCFDVKYGSKLGALNLVHEWIQHIGSKAGLHEENVRVLSGSIGLKESRVEMEVELPNLGDLEKFWFSIPREQHQDWSQRMADFVVDGSPEWQVLRRVPVRPMSKSSESVSTSQSVSEKQDRDKLDAQLKEWDQSFSEETGIRRSRSPSGSGLAPKGLHQDQLDVDEGYLSSVNLNSGERRIIYDMDGNPIKLNKADSIPALAPENSVTFGNYTFIMPEDYKPFVPPSPDEVFPREKFGSDLFDEPDLDDQDYLPKPPRSS